MPPSAVYQHKQTTNQFTTDQVPLEQLTTAGTTTGPSDFVMSKGAVDRDGPSDFNIDSPMGVLRAQVTHLQDDINVFLTERMALAKELELKESEAEKKLLDGGDSDSDSD